MAASFVVTGCAHGERLSTQAAGHAIRAEVTGPHALATTPERAVLTSPYGRVTVERERVQVDGLTWTRIPADVPVDVSIRRGRLRVAAGRVTIGRTVSNQ